MFSSRTDWKRQQNALALALEALGRPPAIDLTVGNPSKVGFRPDQKLIAALSNPKNAGYEPAPMGLPEAREAVVQYYARRGGRCEIEQVWLTASTSEAYQQVLSLVCDPGQAIAVPQPGYPLFDFIGDLAGVRLVHYPVRYDGGWHVDLPQLESQLEDDDVRAVVCVAPGNPTGHYLRAEELASIVAACRAKNRALIVDEVFSDYPLRSDAARVPHVVGEPGCLTFVLSGLSKVAALPQAKLAWGVVCGPEPLRKEAVERLAIINDTFLSASTAAQRWAEPALRAAPLRQAAILQRLRANLQTLRERLADTPIEILDVEGGWSAILRLPALGSFDGMQWALRFLADHEVVVQPGHFFDLDGAHVVVSLMTPPLVLLEGTDAMAKSVARVLASDA